MQSQAFLFSLWVFAFLFLLHKIISSNLPLFELKQQYLSITASIRPPEVNLASETTTTTLVAAVAAAKTTVLQPAGTRRQLAAVERLLKLCDNNCLTFYLHPSRLGNHMFMYASALAIAHQSKRLLMLTHSGLHLPEYFKNIRIPVIPLSDDSQRISLFQVFQAPQAGYYYPEVDEFLRNNSGKNCMLDGLFQSHKYFRKSQLEQKIKKEFIFHKTITTAAIAIIRSVWQSAGFRKRSDVSLVGIHVRRGDTINAYETSRGRIAGSESYIRRAIDYMQNRQSHNGFLMFVMIGEDSEWSRSFAKQLNESSNGAPIVVINPRESSGVDMCILTLCDHVIMTVGTFGWWAAYLSPGIKIYQKQQAVEDSDLRSHYRYEDFFPTEWIGFDA